MCNEIMDQEGRSCVWMNALQISGKSVSSKSTAYLDYAATAPPDPRVIEAMLPFLSEFYGNPSSVHGPGRKARHAVEECREQVAALLAADPGEILFMGSGTEADNSALYSVLSTEVPGHLITSEAEHDAIRNTAVYLASQGARVTFLSPDRSGGTSVDDVEASFADASPFVSIMHVNNETGVVNDVGRMADRVHAENGVIHTDAVQSAACYPLQSLTERVDMMSLSGHKIGGPKGVGLLFVRSGVVAGRVIHGGSQERNRRAGTENVAGIVGFTKALELAQSAQELVGSKIRRKRDRLRDELSRSLGERVLITTPDSDELSCPHILHTLFLDENGCGLDGEMLILGLDMEGVYVSSGAACSSGTIEPSHVLLSMQIDRHMARSAVRYSLGKETTDEEIDIAIDRTVQVVRRVGRQQ